jgi:hypothetical protein
VHQAQFHVFSAPSDKAEHDDDVDVETQEKVLDPSALALDEVIQLVRDTWERGLRNSVPLGILISQMKSLLAADAHGEADGTEHEDFDCVKTLVYSDSEDTASLTSYEGISDAISSVVSVDYAVRSVTSFKERTNWLYRPRSY